jgi:hypothetical protein
MKFRRIETDYVAIGIIAVCLLCIGMNELFNPANVIERAISKSICEYSARETANSPWLDEDLNKNIESGNISAGIALNVSDGMYKGAGIEFNIDRNDSNQTAQAAANLNLNGTALLALKSYADNETAVVSVPALYDKNFSVDVNQLSKNIYNMSGIDFDPESENENVFFNTKVSDSTYNVIYNDLSKAFKTAGNMAWRKASSEREFTSLEKSEVNNLQCKGYEIKLMPEGSKIFLTAFGEELFNNNNFKNAMYTLAKSEFSKNGFAYQLYYQINSPADLSAKLIEGYKAGYDSIINSGELGETSMQLFINSGRLIKGQFGVAITASGQQLDITCDVDFNGENNPTDAVSASIGMYSQGNQIKLSAIDNNVVDGTKINTNKTFSYDNPNGLVSFSFNSSYDEENNNFTADFIQSANDVENTVVKASGTVETQKGGYINADITSFDVVVENQNVLKANGSLFVNPLENEITPIEGETIDLLNMDEEQANEIMGQIDQKLSEIISKFQSK